MDDEFKKQLADLKEIKEEVYADDEEGYRTALTALKQEALARSRQRLAQLGDQKAPEGSSNDEKVRTHVPTATNPLLQDLIKQDYPKKKVHDICCMTFAA